MKIFETVLSNNNWDWGKVGDFYEVTKKPRGMTLTDDDVIAFAPMEVIPQGGETEIEYRLKPWKEIASGTYFEKGNVLISKITPSFENGKQGIADKLPFNFGYASTEIIPLRPKSQQYDRRLLFFFLLHPEVRNWIAEKMEGTTGRQRVPENVLLDLPFPQIEPENQAEIAGSLALIKRLIRINTEKNQILESLFKSLLHKLMTGEIRVGDLDLSALDALENSKEAV